LPAKAIPPPPTQSLEVGVSLLRIRMTPIDLWLSRGQKVKIRNNPYFEGKVGIVEQFYYITGEYLIWLRNSKMPIPFSPSEVEKVA
jgi:hypothetical protein